MLKSKELCCLRQVRFRNGDGVTNESLGTQLLAIARDYAIPAATSILDLKTGGTFKSSVVPCLVLYHPDHPKDFNYYVFSITRQGKYAFVDISLGGNSPNAAARFAKKNLLNLDSLSSTDKGQVIGSLINATVHGALFRDKSKQEEEDNWYTMIDDVIADVFDE